MRCAREAAVARSETLIDLSFRNEAPVCSRLLEEARGHRDRSAISRATRLLYGTRVKTVRSYGVPDSASYSITLVSGKRISQLRLVSVGGRIVATPIDIISES